MKKLTLATLTLLTLILTACGSASSSTPQAGPATQGGTLPVATQLIVGIFKLEDTEQAVTAEQAKQLLPLWQVYRDLLASDTAAQEEIDALVEQAQETLTTDQTQAITALNLTQQDVFTLMQEKGLGISQRSSSSSDNSAGNGNNFGGGGFGVPPDGFVPPDGGQGGPGMGGGQTMDPEQIATAQAARQQTGGGGGAFMPSALLDALIKLLQEKASS